MEKKAKKVVSNTFKLTYKANKRVDGVVTEVEVSVLVEKKGKDLIQKDTQKVIILPDVYTLTPVE